MEIEKTRNCYSCKYYKDGYCDVNLDLEACYPQEGCEEYEEKTTMFDFIYNQINEQYRQMMEYQEKTLAEIITKYDFMVGSKELQEKLHKILPKEANIAYSPFIENNTTIFAIKKFDALDYLLQEPYKPESEESE